MPLLLMLLQFFSALVVDVDVAPVVVAGVVLIAVVVVVAIAANVANVAYVAYNCGS